MSETIDIPAAERFLGVELPPGARDVKTAGEQGIDGLVLIRFDAPANQVDAFAAKVVPGGLKPGTDPHLGSLGDGRGWWIDALPPGAAGGSSQDGAANRSYRMVAQPLDGGRTRVWLAAFSS